MQGPSEGRQNAFPPKARLVRALADLAAGTSPAPRRPVPNPPVRSRRVSRASEGGRLALHRADRRATGGGTRCCVVGGGIHFAAPHRRRPPSMNPADLPSIRPGRTARASSWDTTGRNNDAWTIDPGERRVLADISGPGTITHIWMTQPNHYRECLIEITWDNADAPSILCPLGDFFGLGHGIVNSYQSLLFSASTRSNNRFNQGCALNAYVPMPFRERAVVALVNQSAESHRQYFYIDHELGEVAPDAGYLHAEFRRENPTPGWGHEIRVNTPE
ncbi:MAG: DUF2961 domain-containing protein, partial [Gammaproteobacteria bacterium]|nr:DUF2961 domain-containing protein [Gammaproteobacteria bacterium]